MRFPCIQIDAFTKHPFGGNPAAVCLLLDGEVLSPEVMLAIAAENNLSETAFVRPRDTPFEYDLRWFTPKVEVNLCGHATLATAHALFSETQVNSDSLLFHTLSGPLRVARAPQGNAGALRMDLPARSVSRVLDEGVVERVHAALGLKANEVHRGVKVLALLESSDAVRTTAPNFSLLADICVEGVIITARATATDGCDFVSRFFAPGQGVNEDPVTGSAHAALAPFWSQRLGSTTLRAKQVSARGGEILCRVAGDRVELEGHAVTTRTGYFVLP